MNPDDPFAGLDEGEPSRTVLKPTPGRRAPEGTMVRPARRRADEAPAYAQLRPGLNPLESAAAPLLALMTRLRQTLNHADVPGLRDQVVNQIRLFETQARNLGVDPKTVHVARYVLCTALDDIVLNTPWGSESAWAEQSLLSYFHNEVVGGERFFTLLKRLGQDPGRNLHLLELMHVCLALGFEGRYRVVEDGRAKLEEERERLWRLIRSQRGDVERELSPGWQGVVDARNPLIRYVPLWVVGAVGGAALLIAYTAFNFSLNRASDPVYRQLHELGRNASFVDVRAERPPLLPELSRVAPTLSGLLSEEIGQGLIELEEVAEGAKLVIRGEGLFPSGRASLRPAFHPLVVRIGDALDQVPGEILVTGHTDNVPIFTARFPSNWHLSQARAEAVMQVLSNQLDRPQRVAAEGRADTEPIVPNDTPANRARNRRVEVMVFERAQ